MIIKSIEIQNFRSYYKENEFELINGLNLIIGANGDGKTTFYEALEWVFRTDGTNKMDVKFISKKRTEDLFANESDRVRVAVKYEHGNKNKILEKSFRFTKSYDGEITTSGYEYSLIEDNGVERIVKDGINFDRDITSDIRQYIMFKGEGDLDIFQKSTALKMLIDTFSDVKDFEAYFDFMEYATKKAEQARDNAQKSDRKNAEKIKAFKKTIENETNLLREIDKEIQQKSDEAVNFENLLKNIEKSKEASQLLQTINRRIENLTNKRATVKASIQENYTIDLLDNMWVLMGFEPIAKEYSDKVHEYDLKKRKENQDYLMTQGAEKMIKKIQTDFVPLPAHIPGRKIMQEMLDTCVCKFCNREAPRGSEAWNFMKQRLDEYEASLKVQSIDDEPIEPLFEYAYIDELQKRDTILNDNLSDITKLQHKIFEAIKFNQSRAAEVAKYDKNIESAFEEKKRILAQSDGLTEEQLLANFENISTWTDKQRNAKDRVKYLKNQRQQHRANLDEAQIGLSKLAEGTTAAMYANTWNVISRISEAFKEAKETNKKNLLSTIEDEANRFLDILNIDDFKGTIRIIPKLNDEAEAVLINNDNTRIFNPNTALRTTYLMSVLFAIGQIASNKKESPFPLLFDAPTSSFTGKKEAEFFDVISKLNKQVIIVTKSFLKDAGNGDQILDTEKAKKLNGRVFRIEKKKPFDDRKLGTIQTVITQIN